MNEGTPRELAPLCEAPDPMAADEMIGMLDAVGILARWEGGPHQSGLMVRWEITLYVEPTKMDASREALRRHGIDIDSEDYKLVLAGFSGGVEHWLRFKRQMRWGMVLLPLLIALIFLVQWLHGIFWPA